MKEDTDLAELESLNHAERAKLGSDQWNKWAEANKGQEVDFADIVNSALNSISFDSFIFPGDVSFKGKILDNTSFQSVIFLGNVNFEGTNFHGSLTSFKFAMFTGESTNFSNAIFNNTDAVFTRAEFNCEEVLFIKSEFHGGSANFESVDFNDASVCFNSAKFIGGDALFAGARFSNSDAWFESAVFEHHADFSAVEFSGAADFSSAIFKGPVNLEMASFDIIPDFRRTTLSAHFTFSNMFLNQNSSGDPIAADKLRRLKELAIASKDHERELAFFADELRATRINHKFGPRYISYLYEYCSDFGRSILRPFIGLLVTWLLFGIGYFLASTNPPNNLTEGLTLSAATLVPFVAASRATMADAREALFWPEASGWVNTAAFIEGFIGIIFIFLIGLALRNRFRI